VKELHFQRGPLNFSVGLQPRGQGPSDADASEYSTPYLPFFFLDLCLRLINDQIRSSIILHTCWHLVVPPTVPVHFYELGGAGTLFVNDQREVQERRSRASQGTLTTAERTPVCTLNR